MINIDELSQVNQKLQDLPSPQLAEMRLRIIDVPQKQVFKSAIGTRTSRRALIVELESKEGLVGYGECSCRPDPYYSHEFVDGAVNVLEDFVFPKLKTDLSYVELLRINQQIRGWNFTKGAFEFAYNDLLKKGSGVGLIEHLYREPLSKIPVGISLGLFDSADTLLSKVDEVQKEGYQRLKFKISPGYGTSSIMEALAESNHPNISLDANGSFTEDQFDELEQFSNLGYIIEQPFGPGNEYLHALYIEQNRVPLRMCLDEDIESLGNLLSYSQPIEQVNIKPGRVGGLVETLNMIAHCKSIDLDAWIGGMFETGIGRAQNLQIAALLPNAKAHDLSPSSRYFARDVLIDPIEMKDGFVSSSNFDSVEIDLNALEELTQQLKVLTIA